MARTARLRQLHSGRMIASWVTAGATLLLVLVTLIYVLLTSRLAKQASETARASQRAADAAQQSVLVAAMPLVTVRFDGGSKDKYHLRVHNDGSTAALNLIVTGEWQGVHLPRDPIELPRLAAGDGERKTLSADDSPKAMTAAAKDHKLHAEWSDPFGHRYSSTTEQDVSSGEQRIAISTYVHLGDHWSPLAQS